MPSSLSLSKPASNSLHRAIAACSLSPTRSSLLPRPPRSSGGANTSIIPRRINHTASTTTMATAPTTASATAASTVPQAVTVLGASSSASASSSSASTSTSRMKHHKVKSLLHPAPASVVPPNPALDVTIEVERIPRPLTNSSVAFAQPLPNSYWATPYLVACEYPWSPKCAAYKNLNANSTYPSVTGNNIDLRCPSLVKLLALIRTGVRTFIDLTAPSDALCPYSSFLPALSAALTAATGEDIQLSYHRVPIEDRSLPSSAAVTKLLALLSSLEGRARAHVKAAKSKSPSRTPSPPPLTAIHCRGGIGRTGTIVGCYLVHSGRAKNGPDALRIINSEWAFVEKKGRYPESPETGAQWEYVRSFGRARVDAERIMGVMVGGEEEMAVGSRLAAGAKW